MDSSSADRSPVMADPVSFTPFDGLLTRRGHALREAAKRDRSNVPADQRTKVSKSSHQTVKSVRTRKSLPYLDVPIADNKNDSKTRLLKSKEQNIRSDTPKKQATSKLIKLSPSHTTAKAVTGNSPQGLRERSKSPPHMNILQNTATKSTGKKHKSASPPKNKKKHKSSAAASPVNVEMQAQPSVLRNSPSLIIQNILRDNFETRVKGILPTLWQSSKQLSEMSDGSLGPISIAKDSLLDPPMAKWSPVPDFLTSTFNSHLIGDSRTSTPSNSPTKLKTQSSQELSSADAFDVPNDGIDSNTSRLSTAHEKDPSSGDIPFPRSFNNGLEVKTRENHHEVKEQAALTTPQKGTKSEKASFSPRNNGSVSSSPIAPTFRSTPLLPQLRTTTDMQFPEISSSPVGNRSGNTTLVKMVEFSDDVERISSPPPPSSSPIRILGPLKSILKAKDGDLVHTRNGDTSHDFVDSPFWVSGSVVQLSAGSQDNVELIKRATGDLADATFPHKFEAYTSLNNIVKVNNLKENISWFEPKAPILLRFIRRDVSVDADYSNPFSTRTVIQALKLASFFFSHDGLSSKLPGKASRDFVLQCCHMIQDPKVSKGMASMLLQLLRDQKLSDKIVTPKAGEFVLQAILNMKTFQSTSLTIERLNTLNEFIKAQPWAARKHLAAWFPFLVINLTDTTSVASSRVVASASRVLGEVCKKLLGTEEVSVSLFELFQLPLSMAFKQVPSQSQQSQVDSDSLQNDPKLVEYVCHKLKLVLRQQLGNATFVMNIWFHLTLLLTRPRRNSGKDTGIEHWSEIRLWISVFKDCLEQSDLNSKKSAIRAWRGVIYSCMTTFNAKATDLATERKRFALVIYPFTCFPHAEDIPLAVGVQLHALYLMTVYAFFNDLGGISGTHPHVVHDLWLSLMKPVFDQLYFPHGKVGPLSVYGGELINALICNPAWGKNRRALTFKILSQESLGIQDLNCLPGRWIYQRDSLQEYMLLVFQIPDLKDALKLELFTHYINALKTFTARDAQNSLRKTELSANMPMLVKTLFDNITISNSIDFIFDLLIRLNDCLSLAALIDGTHDTGNVCHSIISKILSYKDYSHERLIELCKFISNTLGYRLQLVFYLDLLDFRNDELHEFVMQKIRERNFTKTTSIEYKWLGEIFLHAQSGDLQDTVVSSLVSHVWNPISEKQPAKAIENLQIENWDNDLFISAVSNLEDTKLKSQNPRNVRIQEILRYLILHRLSSAAPVLALQFMKKICLLGWRAELSEYAPQICKRLSLLLASAETAVEARKAADMILKMADSAEEHSFDALAQFLENPPAAAIELGDTQVCETNEITKAIESIVDAETTTMKTGSIELTMSSESGDSIAEDADMSLKVATMAESVVSDTQIIVEPKENIALATLEELPELQEGRKRPAHQDGDESDVCKRPKLVLNSEESLKVDPVKELAAEEASSVSSLSDLGEEDCDTDDELEQLSRVGNVDDKPTRATMHDTVVNEESSNPQVDEPETEDSEVDADPNAPGQVEVSHLMKFFAKIDVAALSELEKKSLEDDLLKFLMRLRGI